MIPSSATRTMTAAVSGLILALALAGAAPAQSPQSEIEAAMAAFQRAFNDRDAAAITELFTDDAALLPPHSPRVDGTEGIARYWRDLMDAGLSDLEMSASEIEVSGDFAYELGTYSATVPARGGTSVEVEGKYLVIWRQGDDGGWRVHRDIWNLSSRR